MSSLARILVGPPGPRLDADAAGDPLETVPATSLGELRAAAAETTASLLWILDARAIPEPGALDALLEAGTLPAVSLPLDGAGDPIERLIGRYADGDVERLVNAAQRRQVPLRHTHVVSLLVDRDAVLDLEPPDARYGAHAGTEWTARLLARHPGVLVPASRVRAPEPPRATLAGALRMMRTPTWQRGETLLELRRALPG